MNWLERIFGCSHKWETIEKVRHVWEDGTYYYTAYHQQCSKCGVVTIRKVDKPWLT